MRRISHRTIANGFLLALSTVIALAACELILRHLYPEFGIKVIKVSLFTEYDPELGWRLKRNFGGYREVEGRRVYERINARGARGPLIPYRKPPGTYRIVVLGDSMTEGYAVNFDELFSEVMRRELGRTSALEIEVVNLGVGGYSTDQELLLFRREGVRYRPDLVILMFNSNDPKYNHRSAYWRGWKPRFELVDGALKLESLPGEHRRRLWEQSKTNRREDNVETIDFDPGDPDTWYLARFVGFVGRALLHDATSFDLDPNDSSPSSVTAPAPAPGPGEIDEYGLTEALVLALKREAEAAGSDFLVFYVPNLEAFYGRRFHVRRVRKDDALAGVLAGWARTHDIDYVDPHAVFFEVARRLSREGRRLYLRDRHWGVDGNELAGRVLAQAVREHFGERLRTVAERDEPP